MKFIPVMLQKFTLVFSVTRSLESFYDLLLRDNFLISLMFKTVLLFNVFVETMIFFFFQDSLTLNLEW